MDYQPSYGFLKDCLYRSESYKVTLADAYGGTARMPYCVSNTHSASMSAARVSRGGNEQDVSTTTVHPKPAFTKVCFRPSAVIGIKILVGVKRKLSFPIFRRVLAGRVGWSRQYPHP